MQERLQKVLARAGFGSRRYCETLIPQGAVTVNGILVVKPGTTVDPERDTILVYGKPISNERRWYILLYKPRGYLCTNVDTHGRSTVFSLIRDIPERLFTAGRLDKDTEGVLLITNDGGFKNRVMHPRRTIPKVYEAVLSGTITRESRKKLEHGIKLDDVVTMPARINRICRAGQNKSLAEIVLYEGKKRQVKRMFAALGHRVLSLKRIKIGDLDLSGLKPGEYRFLTPEEIESLRA